MITHHEDSLKIPKEDLDTTNVDSLEIPQEYFGQTIIKDTKRADIILLAALVVLISAFTPLNIAVSNLLNGIFSSGLNPVGAGFLLALASAGLACVAIKVDTAETYKRNKDFKDRIDKEYIRWYFTSLIPFLENKYDIKYNEGSSNAFALDGEWVKAKNGKMMKVKLHGVHWTSGTHIGPSLLSQSHPDLKFTHNGKVWLSEAVQAKELYFSPMEEAV